MQTRRRQAGRQSKDTTAKLAAPSGRLRCDGTACATTPLRPSPGSAARCSSELLWQKGTWRGRGGRRLPRRQTHGAEAPLPGQGKQRRRRREGWEHTLVCDLVDPRRRPVCQGTRLAIPGRAHAGDSPAPERFRGPALLLHGDVQRGACRGRERVLKNQNPLSEDAAADLDLDRVWHRAPALVGVEAVHSASGHRPSEQLDC
mmetsp:Transcript_66501/g.210208  ORF Transcript_66501/g.210208 Transcript_66501/m.210208 type:complete len:202 (+) Transcript_66501:95-700(+)